MGSSLLDDEFILTFYGLYVKYHFLLFSFSEKFEMTSRPLLRKEVDGGLETPITCWKSGCCCEVLSKCEFVASRRLEDFSLIFC